MRVHCALEDYSGADFGMLVLETIAKIRLAYFQHGKSIKRICRELKISRNVVRKVVRSGETEFNYERSVQPQPKIGPFRNVLDQLLEENSKRSRRERLTAVRIYEELRNQGYNGGYDAVRRYASAWKQRETEVSSSAFVPLSFDPGEAFQFDWSQEIVVIDGITITLKVAHVRLVTARLEPPAVFWDNFVTSVVIDVVTDVLWMGSCRASGDYYWR